MENKNEPTFDDLILEPELMEMFGVKREALGQLRYKEGLPFLKVNTRNRLYLKQDIVNWLSKRRIVLNKDEINADAEESIENHT